MPMLGYLYGYILYHGKFGIRMIYHIHIHKYILFEIAIIEKLVRGILHYNMRNNKKRKSRWPFPLKLDDTASIQLLIIIGTYVK